MKKIIYTLAFTAALTVGFNQNSIKAADLKEVTDAKTEVVLTEAQKEARITAMKLRVEEIKAMDKSELTKAERKALKKELRDMNKEARALGAGGVYLSVGAIIIIILVLILIL